MKVSGGHGSCLSLVDGGRGKLISVAGPRVVPSPSSAVFIQYSRLATLDKFCPMDARGLDPANKTPLNWRSQNVTSKLSLASYEPAGRPFLDGEPRLDYRSAMSDFDFIGRQSDRHAVIHIHGG